MPHAAFNQGPPAPASAKYTTPPKAPTGLTVSLKSGAGDNSTLPGGQDSDGDGVADADNDGNGDACDIESGDDGGDITGSNQGTGACLPLF